MSDTSYSVYFARDMKVQWAKRQSNLQRKKNRSLVCAGKEVRMKREPWIFYKVNESAPRDEVFSCANDSAVQFNDD